jgi:peptidoglycan-associated lipoprotein
MKSFPHSLRSLVLVSAALAALAACGGSKRPPAVTAGGAGRSAPGSSTGRAVPVEPVDAGPDLAPPGEGSDVTGTDFDLGGSPEGGPLADIHFDYDQATLSDEVRATLEKHALWLQNHRDVRVTVEGHCDERGTTEYNLALGEQRARAAYEYLASLGVAGDRLKSVSYGKERPVDPGRGEDAWRKNRRAHFAVSR